MHKHVGPYQRPAPPKKPGVSAKPKAIQVPSVPLHEIEAMGRAVIENAMFGSRKPGRPSINQQPMTAAERQARRRERQARNRDLQATLEIGETHGKSRAEADSGGYNSMRMDAIYSARETEYLDGDGSEAHTGRRINPNPSADGSNHREGQKVFVRGLRIGDEESNRRRFAEDELTKMVWEYFNSSTNSPTVPWIAKHVGNSSMQTHAHVALTLRCKLCPDAMASIEDGRDHLLVDHLSTIKEWFKNLNPPREFRDMRDYVTVVTPHRRAKNLASTS
jgi:hypothetical protein